MEGRLGPRKVTVSNRVSTTKDNVQSCPIVHEFIVAIIVVKVVTNLRLLGGGKRELPGSSAEKGTHEGYDLKPG